MNKSISKLSTILILCFALLAPTQASSEEQRTLSKEKYKEVVAELKEAKKNRERKPESIEFLLSYNRETNTVRVINQRIRDIAPPHQRRSKVENRGATLILMFHNKAGEVLHTAVVQDPTVVIHDSISHDPHEFGLVTGKEVVLEEGIIRVVTPFFFELYSVELHKPEFQDNKFIRLKRIDSNLIDRKTIVTHELSKRNAPIIGEAKTKSKSRETKKR